ncbi:uncharacterized protein [Mytilus edulis]|uniref:uncharacterized protein n=1 Tax=Mytilus edulis TaxID=6550 RepID=UPI0039F120D9
MSRKASSLSHLLQVIVESFIPDTYKKYLTLNVKASEQARSYAPDIPAFLVNRPPDMVRHCFKRWEEAQYIEASDIDTVCDQTGTFIVKSQGSKDSTLNYLVKFEGDELGLPACDCEDWKKNHLVCKHFMAVFTHMKGWIWEKLPETYKSSPFLNLDIPFGNNFNSCAAVSVEVQNDGDDIDAENNEYLTELPLPSATRIKKTRQEFLSLCTEMKDLSYKTKDIDILRSVVEDANSILIKLKLNIPQTKEFILEEGGMTKTKITNKAKKKKVHIPFKRSRTKQKGSGRVGITASKVKECFTKKGVHELATEEKRPQLNIVEELNIADDFGQTIVIDEKDNSKSKQ